MLNAGIDDTSRIKNTDVQTTGRPLRIGVLILNLEGESARRALSYLVLYLNRLQKFFEYELLPAEPGQHPLLQILNTRGPINRKDTKASFFSGFHKEYAAAQDIYLTSYKIKEPLPDRFVILCDAVFNDGYYLTGNEHLQVVALGNWKKEMAPPSIVEFFLTLLVRSSINLLSREMRSKHYGTKGCLQDFNAHLGDVRLKVLHAFICSSCRETLELHPETRGLSDALMRVLDTSWLGSSTDPMSPAGIASKLGYDLLIVRGRKPTFFESATSTLREDGVKETIKLLTLLLGAALLAWLGLKR